MNVLFLTMSDLLPIEKRGIYTDLLRKLRDEGHNIYTVMPIERRNGIKTSLIEQSGVRILSVQTLNVYRANVIEKGLGQVSIEYLFKQAIKKYYKGIHFDMVLYSTPPVTFPKVIEYVRKCNPNVKTYLLLKDIFPQNAVDLGMLSKRGLKGMVYRSFRKKEKRLYKDSDWIGCMSPANVQYVLDHNPEVARRHSVSPMVEVAPNSHEVRDYIELDAATRTEILAKYGVPSDKPVFIYGGNMGKPQGIPFLIECLKANASRDDCHFVVVGDGVDYHKLEQWYNSEHPKSVTVFKHLHSEEYNQFASACDVGLVFLDYRFTIPNYPSRLLTHLMKKQPVLACTDPNCDTGAIAEENGYGFWCPSNSVESFTRAVDKMLASDIKAMGEKGYKFFLENYTVENTCHAILKHF